MICTTARPVGSNLIPAGTATPLLKPASTSQLNYLVSKQTVIKQQLLLRTIWVHLYFAGYAVQSLTTAALHCITIPLQKLVPTLNRN